MIEVKDHESDKWKEREFVAMTPCGKHVCWSKRKIFVYGWEEAREIDPHREDEKTYKKGVETCSSQNR
jgi:hypothetical protein